MNKTLFATITALAVSLPVLADSPAAADKKNDAHEQMETHQEMKQARAAGEKAQVKAAPYRMNDEEKRAFAEKKAKHEHADGQYDGKKIDKMARKPDGKMPEDEQHEEKLKGKEKQQDKKMEQERKELDKGSEQGPMCQGSCRLNFSEDNHAPLFT